MENQDAVETLDSIHKGTFNTMEDTAIPDLVEVIKLLDDRIDLIQEYLENRVPHL